MIAHIQHYTLHLRIASLEARLDALTSIGWHVDDTYIRVSGKWRYLWRIVDDIRQTSEPQSSLFAKQIFKLIEHDRAKLPGVHDTQCM